MAAVNKVTLKLIRCNSLIFSSLSNFSTVLDVLKNGVTGNKIEIQGWVTAIRKMKEVIFMDVNDGSCFKSLQVVIPKSNRPENLTSGSSVKTVGKLRKNHVEQLELQADSIQIIGSIDSTHYPFSPKQKHSHEYCRQYLHLRSNLPHVKSMLRVRHHVLRAIYDWFDSKDFLSIHTPILTINDCEGAGEIFGVQPVSQALINEMKKKGQSDKDAFFGSPAFLSVSGQLHLEAVSRSFVKVYSLSPTFRAENSKSRLHLSEFYMLEAEESFVTTLDQILETIEQCLKHVISAIVTNCRDDLEAICHYDSVDVTKHILRLENIVNSKFERRTYEEASKVIAENEHRFKSPFCEMKGFSKEHELFLVEKCWQCPVFITEWPKSMKPFYMKSNPGNPELVSAVDLLVPNVGELCGGSLREDDADCLEKKLSECGLLDSMQWYLDLRRFGNVPTGGFGMGVERLIQLVTGLTNIKDTIPFPRWPHNLKM